MKRCFTLSTDPQSAEILDSSFQAAAIAFMAHGQHNDGHATTFGGLHKLFTMVRDYKGDFDVEAVENVIGSTKDLLFDVVCYLSVCVYYTHKVINFLEGNGIGSNDRRCYISCLHQWSSALSVAF